MIYHVVTQSEWYSQKDQDHYAPNDFSNTGFIHCCTESQLTGVLQRYFAGQTELLLISLDEHKLEAALKYEPNPEGELFPHLFRPINKQWVVEVKEIE